MQRCLAHITHARNVLQSWQLLGHWLENPECPQNPCFPWTAHEYPTQAPVSVRSEHPYTVDSIPQQNTKGTTLKTFRAIIPLLQNPVPNIDFPEWARVVWLLEKWLWHPPCNCGLNQGGVVIKKNLPELNSFTRFRLFILLKACGLVGQLWETRLPAIESSALTFVAVSPRGWSSKAKSVTHRVA